MLSAFTGDIWLRLLAVSLVTLFSAGLLAKFAESLKLVALPGEHRQHRKATPMVGGLAIYVGLLFGMIMLDNSYAKLLPALLLLCSVGALDDRYKLPSWSRFMMQGMASYMMILMTGAQLNSLGYLSPDSEWLLGRWSVPMTIFATIGVINAINMSDGHDGLAGSLVLVVLTALLVSGAEPALILVTGFAVLGFLCLNVRLWRPRALIFMGDAGSTMLGLLLAYLLISHSQSDSGFQPVTALWFLALPLIDAVAVLLVRPMRRRSPFTADRIHYHHQLVDRGLSVNWAVSIAVVIQCGFMALGFWAWRTGVTEHLQLKAFLSLFVLYLLSLLWFTRSSKNRLN